MACSADNVFLLLAKQDKNIALDLALLTLASMFPSDTLDMAKVLGKEHAKHMVVVLAGRSFLGTVRANAREYVRHIL